MAAPSCPLGICAVRAGRDGRSGALVPCVGKADPSCSPRGRPAPSALFAVGAASPSVVVVALVVTVIVALVVVSAQLFQGYRHAVAVGDRPLLQDRGQGLAPAYVVEDR